MKSLFNIISIYLENPLDKDMERVVERESNKNNTIKLYQKIKDLETQLKQKEAEIKKLKVMWSELALYVDNEQRKMIHFARRCRNLKGVSNKMNKLYDADLSKIDRPKRCIK